MHNGHVGTTVCCMQVCVYFCIVYILCKVYLRYIIKKKTHASRSSVFQVLQTLNISNNNLDLESPFQTTKVSMPVKCKTLGIFPVDGDAHLQYHKKFVSGFVYFCILQKYLCDTINPPARPTSDTATLSANT